MNASKMLLRQGHRLLQVGVAPPQDRLIPLTAEQSPVARQVDTERALLERGQAALAELRQQSPGVRFDLAVADLASLTQVRRLADDLKARLGRLDVLINNAGVKPLERRVTEDGFELTFAVNHLSHFLLTGLLLDLLRAAPQGRVITVSSVSQMRGRMHFDDLQFTRGWDSSLAYAQSKLANVLFAFGLARRLAGTAVTSDALASVHAATAPDLAAASGQYCGVGAKSPIARRSTCASKINCG